MDIEAFKEYYLDPISLGLEDSAAPLPQIFKSMQELKITAEEAVTDSRTTYTFINKNLDIITIPHEAYLYVTTTNSQSSGDLDQTNLVGIPNTAGLIDGFDFLINDTTVCTQNNSLASTLYAVNNAVFAPDSKSLEYVGLADEDKGPINLQSAKKDRTGACEWKIPLKYVIPFLKENKILWGVKQTLKITRATVADVIYAIGAGTAVPHGDIELTDIQLRMPYVKLENQKQLALWNSMYSSEVNRYWLDCDQFMGDIDSNIAEHTNKVFRVTTKGLQNKPRYLLLHAVDPSSTAGRDKYRPIGFGNTTYADASNALRLKKLRIKLNGIYIDSGDVLEFTNVSAGTTNAAANDPYANHKGYHRAYDEYCKFFGQYYSKRDSVKSFDDWLQSQLYVFDLNNIDSEQIFASSGNSLIIEIEYSTYVGTDVAANFRLVANVMYDKMLTVRHSDNRAILTVN